MLFVAWYDVGNLLQSLLDSLFVGPLDVLSNTSHDSSNCWDKLSDELQTLGRVCFSIDGELFQECDFGRSKQGTERLLDSLEVFEESLVPAQVI